MISVGDFRKRFDAWLFIRSRARWGEVLSSPWIIFKTSRRLGRGETLRFEQKVYGSGIAPDFEQLNMRNELRKRAEACAILYDAEIVGYEASESLEKFWNWNDAVYMTALSARFSLRKNIK